VDELCQAKVEDLETPVSRKAKIGRLKVAMNDALCVGGGQALRKLQTQANDFLRAQWARGEPFVQRRSRDVFRD